MSKYSVPLSQVRRKLYNILCVQWCRARVQSKAAILQHPPSSMYCCLTPAASMRLCCAGHTAWTQSRHSCLPLLYPHKHHVGHQTLLLPFVLCPTLILCMMWLCMMTSRQELCWICRVHRMLCKLWRPYEVMP